MNDDDVLVTKLQRSARSVARLSSATRVVAIAMLVVAGMLFLYAIGRADRHFEDFIGFSLVAIATTALALVFWSTAAFHAAFGSSTALLTELHLNVERMARLQREQHERLAASALPAAPRAALASAPATPPALPTGAASAPAAEAAGAPAPAASDPATSSVEPAPTAPAEATARAADKKRAKDAPPAAPKPLDRVLRTCKRCGSDVREGASRCRICLEKV